MAAHAACLDGALQSASWRETTDEEPGDRVDAEASAVVPATEATAAGRCRPRDPGARRRRAAGETLRALARDYQVAHTTLARYFKRADVARQLRTARRLIRAHHTRPQAPAQPPAH